MAAFAFPIAIVCAVCGDDQGLTTHRAGAFEQIIRNAPVFEDVELEPELDASSFARHVFQRAARHGAQRKRDARIPRHAGEKDVRLGPQHTVEAHWRDRQRHLAGRAEQGAFKAPATGVAQGFGLKAPALEDLLVDRQRELVFGTST